MAQRNFVQEQEDDEAFALMHILSDRHIGHARSCNGAKAREAERKMAESDVLVWAGDIYEIAQGDIVAILAEIRRYVHDHPEKLIHYLCGNHDGDFHRIQDAASPHARRADIDAKAFRDGLDAIAVDYPNFHVADSLDFSNMFIAHGHADILGIIPKPDEQNRIFYPIRTTDPNEPVRYVEASDRQAVAYAYVHSPSVQRFLEEKGVYDPDAPKGRRFYVFFGHTHNRFHEVVQVWNDGYDAHDEVHVINLGACMSRSASNDMQVRFSTRDGHLIEIMGETITTGQGTGSGAIPF